MQRVVIALTSLLTITGAAIVGAYLLLFGAGADQAARVVPAGTPLYLSVYLQPSAGQRMNLEALVSRLPGFSDTATFDEKIDQVVQNLLATADVDYDAEIKPWLGDQIAVAVDPGEVVAGEPEVLAVAVVKDRAVAEQALAAVTERTGRSTRSETYEGVELILHDEGGYAFVGELLVFGSSPERLQAAVDVERGARPALADDERFKAAMAALPTDHLASGYLDFEALADAGDGAPADLMGLSDASFVLVAEEAALRIAGQAPLDASRLDETMRDALAAQDEAATLAEWMPADTQIAATVFGARQWLAAAEQRAASSPEGQELTDALATIRTLAAIGLGVDLDADLLPLLDREVAVAVRDIVLGDAQPRGLLLLRPSDPDAVQPALDRIREQLEAREASVSDRQAAGTSVVSVEMPQLGEISYAVTDGVAILGFSADEVVAALEARASGDTLAASDAYRQTFAMVEGGGTRLYVDVGSLLVEADIDVALPTDARDILAQLGSFGLTAPAGGDSIEFNAVLTVR